MTNALESHLQGQIDRFQQLFWHRVRWSAVRTYLPEGVLFELVDVGAGAGFVGEFLSTDRPEAVYRFVEPIESLRVHLVASYGASNDAGDSPDYRSARFVTLLDVLEHQDDDVGFLETLASKMAPGSKLIMTVPALQRLWSAWDVSLGHFRRYEKQTLTQRFAGLPFTIDEVNYLFPELVPLARLRARRKPALGDQASQEAELPDLPRPLNEILYAIGTASLSLRRWWWNGSSLFLVATRISRAGWT